MKLLLKKKATIEVQGPCQVTAADLKLPEGVSVLNADQVICHIDDKAKFKAELIIESGKGYRDSSKLANDNNEIGLINIDTVFLQSDELHSRLIVVELGKL